jgi:hypothetical protein
MTFEFVPGQKPMPAEFPRNLGELVDMLEATPPTGAKLINAETGEVVIYCQDRTRKLYFRNTASCRRLLKQYGLSL